MSEEKDKKKEEKSTTDTTGQTATQSSNEDEKKEVTITVKHEFKTEKPAETSITDDKKDEKSAEKPVEKTAETSTETPKEKELREKLEEREGQLATIALKAFEDEKEAFLSKIKDPEKRTSAEKMIGDDPDKLTSAQMMAELITAGIEQSGGVIKDSDSTKIDSTKPPETKPPETKPPETKPETKPEDTGVEPVPPAGVAKAPPAVPKSGITRDVIDELFTILSDPSKSQKEKDAANIKINELYAEFRRGAKEGGAKAWYPLAVMTCPKCGATMEGNVCATCGYEIPKIQR